MRWLSVFLLVLVLAGAASPVPITQQQVAELQKKVDQKKTELDAIDKKSSELENQASAPGGQPADIEQSLANARSSVASLESVKQGMLRNENQSFLNRQTRQNELQVDSQIQANQFRDQLAREQNQLQVLKHQLAEQKAANLNTDQEHELEAAVPAQEQRIAQLQDQYQQFEMQVAAAVAQVQVSPAQATVSGDDLTALNRQIQEQEAIIAKLEAESAQSQQRQQAGVAEDEALKDRHNQAKREYDELSQQLAAEKQALALQAQPTH